jgi:hypothetical protein
MSAKAPAGRINRKNGSVAAVDIRERSNVDWLMLYIIQVAAVSCADTQVPETTVANQSLLKVGFFKAHQLEVAVIKTEEISPPKYNKINRHFERRGSASDHEFGVWFYGLRHLSHSRVGGLKTGNGLAFVEDELGQLT